MKRIKRFLIIISFFVIPLLSLAQDGTSFSGTTDQASSSNTKTESSTTIADGIILLLVLTFSFEVFKFYYDEKESRELEKSGSFNEM